MLQSKPPRLIAILQALFVTFLWATSWVLIKIGLADIPPLTFAGLRYFMAFLCLLPFAFQRERLERLRALPRREWARLAVLGLLFYAVAQGAQFVALAYLPAVTISLLLNFNTIVIALLGIAFLAERPRAVQWVGVAISIIGALVFFYPVAFLAHEGIGYAAVLACLFANAIASVMSRGVNREARLDALSVTAVSMGVGAVVLLVGGAAAQGVPIISPINWLIILWMAVVNTAFAFTLFNHALRTLTAVESSVIVSTMLVMIAVLAWLFLGEQITLQKGAGMLLVGAGVVIVQLRQEASAASA
ncbi:MAG: DMT family transporter [Chloroflexi bacterium]|nr:DMT family transporter [Chloroflexota bacterium]